jgi:Flp pilus assembly pilin Flp
MRRFKAWSKAGQSTLEYILIIAVVLVALIAAATNMQQGVDTMVDQSKTAIQAASERLRPELGL